MTRLLKTLFGPAILAGALALATVAPAFAGLSATLNISVPSTMSLSGFSSASYSQSGAAGTAVTFNTGVQTVTGNDSLGYNVQQDATATTFSGVGPTTFTVSANTCSLGLTCITAQGVATGMATIVSKAAAPAAAGDTFTLVYSVTLPASTLSGTYSNTVNEVLNAL